MAKQLASVPEDSSTDFTAPSPACYSYRESFLSVAGPLWRIKSTLFSQSSQSGSNHSSISGAGASSSYRFNISGSASAGGAELGADELHLHPGRPSIHKVSTSSVAKQLVSVPEESTTGFTAPSPQCFSYRELIRSVAWPEWSIRSNLPALSGQSGSNYSSGSSALSSYFSSNSGSSSGLGSAGATDFRAGELTKIAHRMVSDGYTKHMVQAFADGGGRDLALKNWFVELDVEWVLKDSARDWASPQHKFQPLIGNTSASSHPELIEKWVRALTIIVASIKKELAAAVRQEMLGVAHFGEATISKMLVFIELILHVFKVENLQAMLHMYSCVSSASYDMFTMHSLISSKAQSIAFGDIGDSLEHSLISSKTRSIFTEIADSLETKADNIIEAISTTMMKVGMILDNDDDDDLWATEILRGGGEVHRKTWLMVDCISLMRKTHASTHNSSQSQHTRKLSGLIQDTINHLNNLLLEKSELCLDPSLTCLFLLNNSYFVAQEVSELSIPLDVELSSVHHRGLKLIPECQKYMDSYLDSSWGYVASCILQSKSLGRPKNRKKISSLVKFQSAFHQTYQAQKFWKVPDPQLRSLLRETISKRVIPGYRDYLKQHSELEKQVRGGSNSPEVFEEMLRELFEG